MIAGSDGPAVGPAECATAQLGVRPEQISFAPTGVPATILSSEYFGADTVTTCGVGNQKLLVRTAGRPALAPGDTAHLRWPPGAAHLFDAATGARRDQTTTAPA